MTPAERTLLLRTLTDVLLLLNADALPDDRFHPRLQAARTALDAEAAQDSGQAPKPASDAPSRSSVDVARTACQHADYWQTDRYRKCRDCGAMSYFVPAWGPWH